MEFYKIHITDEALKDMESIYDIYQEKEKYILSCDQIGKTVFEGRVQGTADEPYHVIIDVNHPRMDGVPWEIKCPRGKK